MRPLLGCLLLGLIYVAPASAQEVPTTPSVGVPVPVAMPVELLDDLTNQYVAGQWDGFRETARI